MGSDPIAGADPAGMIASRPCRDKRQRLASLGGDGRVGWRRGRLAPRRGRRSGRRCRQPSLAMSSMTANTAGTNTSDSSVEDIRPPITAIAIGERNSPPEPSAVGRRQHAADHGDGGHDDGPRALAAGIDDGLGARHAALHLLDGEVDQHDGVLGDDAHQHQDADHDRQADRLAGDGERDDGAADRQRQREQDGDRAAGSCRTAAPARRRPS